MAMLMGVSRVAIERAPPIQIVRRLIPTLWQWGHSHNDNQAAFSAKRINHPAGEYQIGEV
jgi:hypothetical protein